jgi:hypothetical protein
LNSVSCVSTSYGVAVGDLGQVLVWNGVTWSAPRTISPYPIDQVSCGAVGACAAVAGGRLLRLSGGAWTAPFPYPGIVFRSISCTNASSCLAVDYSGAVPVVDGVVGFETPLAIGAFDPNAISCPTPTFCVEVSGPLAAIGR